MFLKMYYFPVALSNTTTLYLGTYFFLKIPPDTWPPAAPPEMGKLPLPKGGTIPLFVSSATAGARQKGARGDFMDVLDPYLNGYRQFLQYSYTVFTGIIL